MGIRLVDETETPQCAIVLRRTTLLSSQIERATDRETRAQVSRLTETRDATHESAPSRSPSPSEGRRRGTLQTAKTTVRGENHNRRHNQSASPFRVDAR